MGLVEALLQRCSSDGDPNLRSCPRRTIWTAGESPDWYAVRGNAYLILLVAAEEAKYIWDDGHEHFRTLDDRLLTFRAGPWRDWWSNDIRWEAEMLGCSAAVVLWENNRILTTVELSGFNGLLDLTPPRVGDPPRLPKDTARAGQCWYCPVREKCDGWDELHGETGDWPDKWGK